MKYFVLSDIHGDYNAMIKGLKDANYDENNPEHQIITIGDNFGRASTGAGSYGIWKFLTSEKHINKPVCIRGNHEDILLKIFERGHMQYIDVRNGEDKTIYNLFSHIPNITEPKTMDPVYEVIKRKNKSYNKDDDFDLIYDGKTGEAEIAALEYYGLGNEFVEWIESMPFYFETDNYIFTHGWLRCCSNQVVKYEDMPNTYDSYEDYLEHTEINYKYRDLTEDQWYNCIWVETPNEYSKHCSFFPNGWKKWLVVGHWHAFAFTKKGLEYGDEIYDHLAPSDFNYVVDGEHKVIFCDHCTALGHKINVLVLEDTITNKENEVKQ